MRNDALPKPSPTDDAPLLPFADAPVSAAGQESQFASPPSGGSGGLSGGAIAGIVIGALAGAGILIMATLLLLKRRRGAHT